MMRVLLVVLGCLALGVQGGNEDKKIYLRRCRMGQSCYPTRNDICELKKELQGRVILPSDAGYRDAILLMNRRATKFPGIVVQVMSNEDVQKALKFARGYHLHVSVKYDNFDTNGRSSNDGGIVIDLSQWKVTNSVLSSSRSPAGEITVSAGDTWEEVYTAVNALTSTLADGTVQRRLVVGSWSRQESVGRFVQDNGLGPLSRTYGLAGDNLLEATVVTPKGKIVKTSASGTVYLGSSGWSHGGGNSDLFFAIRGGGAGTFGIVTEFTFRLHIAPANLNQYSFTHIIYDENRPTDRFVGRNVAGQLFNLLAPANLEDVFNAMITAQSGNLGTAGREGSLSVDILMNSPVTAIFSATMNNFVTLNPDNTLLNPGTATTVATFMEFINTVPAQAPANAYYVNTFVPLEALSDANKRAALVDLFLNVVSKPTIQSTVTCRGTVLGGAISNVPAAAASVNPLIRSSGMLVTCSISWPENLNCEDTVLKEGIQKLAERLEDIGDGVLFAGANEYLPNWKDAIFGSHYAKLVNVKRHYDPDNFLFCEHCVASDFRFDCPPRRPYLRHKSLGQLFEKALLE